MITKEKKQLQVSIFFTNFANCFLLCTVENFVMADYDSVVAGILTKIRVLKRENARLQEELDLLTKRCDELQQATENQYILTNNLTEHTNKQQLGNTLETKGDPTDIKQRINQLIKTIDESLALLAES